MKSSTKAISARASQQRGFSLIELMVVVVVLFIVCAVVFRAADMFQQRGFSENEKVDSVQAARDFMDTVSRDVHDAGYPPLPVSANGSLTCVGNPNLACGIVYYTPLRVQYEGDLDGTGTVYQVTLQVVPGANGGCPCVLQRGIVTKAAALAGAIPTYYTEVNGLLNSGNWVGGSTYAINLSPGNYAGYANADVFDGYFLDSTLVTTNCTSAATCVNSATPIRELQVTANIAPAFADPVTHLFPVFSITSKARFNNLSQ